MTAFVEEQGLTGLLGLREVGHSTMRAPEARVRGVGGGRTDNGW
jgi:hypothetical protein